MFCPINLKDIQNIKKQTSEPFYYYDGDMIKMISENFMSSFSKYFRGFRNFYKVRELNNPKILELIFKCGIDFDVTSREELDLITGLGILPKHISYTNNFTSEKDMIYAYNNQVNINMDNISDLDVFDKLRIKYDNKLITHDNIICFNLNARIKPNNNVINKFGISNEDIIKNFKKAFVMGYDVFGIKCINEYDTQYNMTDYDVLFQNIFNIIDILRKNNIIIDFINLGEIFDITYETPQNLRKIFDKYIEIYELDNEPEIYAECTSHITKNYGWLITECNSIKKIINGIDKNTHNEQNIETNFGLNANMTNLYQKVNDESNISVFGKKTDNKINANIVGNTYDYNDVFAKDIIIPEINVGDIVIIHNVGINNVGINNVGINKVGINNTKYDEFMRYNNNIQTITKNNNQENHDIFTDILITIVTIINFIIFYIIGMIIYSN
jgi:diaminopimelate decarboxylase